VCSTSNIFPGSAFHLLAGVFAERSSQNSQSSACGVESGCTWQLTQLSAVTLDILCSRCFLSFYTDN
jgi:hypothetical protein